MLVVSNTDAIPSCLKGCFLATSYATALLKARFRNITNMHINIDYIKSIITCGCCDINPG